MKIKKKDILNLEIIKLQSVLTVSKNYAYLEKKVR